ncbi:MAG: hypothetical protein H7Y02_02025 [Candidatus Obscuribacterales bacterium]|nr:hypothetical protein [Steroidobacteraceae bacterium]
MRNLTNTHDSQPALMALWPLPLLAVLLPVAGTVAALQISIHLELVPACNPLFDGCMSISRAGRYGLANIVFRAALLPAAALQALTWILCSRWLASLSLASKRLPVQRIGLTTLGVTACCFLVLYGSFLGTENPAYRWLRQYGTIVYFGFSYLCMLLVIRQLRQLANTATRIPRWTIPLMIALCATVLALGLMNTLVAQWFNTELKDRIENVTEWWAAIAFGLVFVVLANVWRRLNVCFRITSAD